MAGGDDSEIKKAKGRLHRAKSVEDWRKKLIDQEKMRKAKQKARVAERKAERERRGPTERQLKRLKIRKVWKKYREVKARAALWNVRRARERYKAKMAQEKAAKLAAAKPKRQYIKRRARTPEQRRKKAEATVKKQARRQQTVLRRREKRKAATVARKERVKAKKIIRKEKKKAAALRSRRAVLRMRKQMRTASRTRIRNKMKRVRTAARLKQVKRRANIRRMERHNRELSQKHAVIRRKEKRARAGARSKALRLKRSAEKQAIREWRKATHKHTQKQLKGRKGIIAAALGRIGTLMGAVIAVGLTGELGARKYKPRGGEPLDVSVAGIAYLNEYGFSDPEKGINIPERPFMRLTIFREKLNWFKMAADIARKQYKGAERVEMGLRRLGLKMVQNHKKTIRLGVEPPNAPYTIKKKGSSKPLVDTGQLINSIRAEIMLPDGTQELIA
jgi:hypothetical protein